MVRSQGAAVRTEERRRARRSALQVTAVIALGGVLGALGRYAVGVAMPTGDTTFPLATFAVNVAGCLAIGVLMALLDAAGRPRPLVRPFAGTGFLGGFTTFSTYAVGTHDLLVAGRTATAAAYAVGTVFAALVAVAVGSAFTRALTVRAAAGSPGQPS